MSRLSNSLKKALSKSQQFHGWKPRWIRKVVVEWPKALVLIGVCPRIDYVSDKWDGEFRLYWHKFDSPPQLFLSPEKMPNGDTMLVVIGKFNVTDEGIIG